MDELQRRHKTEEQRRYEKHARWQEIRITQFGYVNYLVLTLAVGALGFVASLLTDGTTSDQPHRVYEISLWIFAVSSGFGIYCAYIRLCDFRKTAKITKLLMQGGGHDKTGEVKNLRCKTKILGKCSWTLLKWQMALFATGIILLGFTLLVTPLK